ncbi:hypothetical protein HYU23_02305 [Candidatus Woesearchaeota archaeon]|nr:hypothetical protein [Candidatus Woesearchaeota archaeon]
MKKSSILFLFIGVFTILLYACTPQPPQVPIKENVTEVKVIASCDDSNQCTEDLFNQLTQQCEHKRLDHCCGDRTCDSDERCDLNTHKTKCPEDCPRNCPVSIVTDNIECTGKCIKGEEMFLVDGDTKFTMKLQNIGELSANDITSSFRCIKTSGITFISSSTATEKSGITFRDYFNENDKKIYLSGAPYGKDSATYNLEIKGIPREEVMLICTVNINFIESPSSTEFKVKLVKV